MFICRDSVTLYDSTVSEQVITESETKVKITKHNTFVVTLRLGIGQRTFLS